MTGGARLLEVHLDVDYPSKPGVLRGIDLEADAGEIVGVIGESGSGKSTIALAILRLLEFRGGRVRGRILFDGRDLMLMKERELRRIRGREIGLVLQSPVAALNPALRLATQMREAWRAHRSEPWREGRREVARLFDTMGLPDGDGFLAKHPRHLSVGQAQRVIIAMAVLHRPKLLIADEPTSALDTVSRAETLDLLRRLNRELGMAVLFISHDLDSVAGFCDRVAVIRDGELAAFGCADILTSRAGSRPSYTGYPGCPRRNTE